MNGVIPCRYEGCTKAARSAARGFCRRHGEERRCKTPGCNKVRPTQLWNDVLRIGFEYFNSSGRPLFCHTIISRGSGSQWSHWKMYPPPSGGRVMGGLSCLCEDNSLSWIEHASLAVSVSQHLIYVKGVCKRFLLEREETPPCHMRNPTHASRPLPRRRQHGLSLNMITSFFVRHSAPLPSIIMKHEEISALLP